MGGSEGVTRAARTYFMIRIWSAPLALANYVVLGWLIGQARARLALAVQIAINLINMAATVLLVLVRTPASPGPRSPPSSRKRPGSCSASSIARRLTQGQPAMSRATLLDRDQADPHAVGQPRHHDPHRGADRGVPVLHRARRARRRRDAGRQRGAEQFPADQRVLPRWPRQRRRAALRPRLWRARPRRVLRRGPAGAAVGIRLCARGDRRSSRCSARR